MNINDLNKEYAKTIKENQELLIKAFTLYYGEKYYTHIKNVINKINFVWYIPPVIDKVYNQVLRFLIRKRIIVTKEILKILDINFEEVRFKGIFKEININHLGIVLDGSITKTMPSLESLTILKTLFGRKGLFDLDYETMPFMLKSQDLNISFEKKDKLNSYIESIKDSFKNEENYYIMYYLKEYITKNNNLKNKIWQKPWYVLSNNENINKNVLKILAKEMGITYAFQTKLANKEIYVVFPILLISDKEFIHEVNHALKTFTLATVNHSLIEKSGLSLFVNKECQYFLLEEVVNDLEAQEITDIFHSLGGSLFTLAPFLGKDIDQGYQNYFPLIEEFYERFKDLIIDCSLNEDLNVLFKRIDKEKYFKYVKWIENTIASNIDIDEDIFNESYFLAKNLAKDYEEEDLLKNYDIIGQTKSGILRVKRNNR